MKIALLGDIGVFGRFARMTKADFDEYYKEYIKVIDDCDYVIGNLEVPFSIKNKEFTAKSACISANPDDVSKLSSLKLTHVNLANNHTGDFGAEGYDLTINLLDKQGITYFGVAGKQELIEFEGSKIALSGFCNMDSNPVYLYKHDDIGNKGVNVANVPEMLTTLTKNHEGGYLNIFAFHSGLEHVHLPDELDQLFARKVSDALPYIHYGHHPHVAQGYEKLADSHIFYSLGNFCFDDVYSKISKKPLVEMSEHNRICLVPVLTINSNLVEKVDLHWFRLGESSFELLAAEENDFIKKVQNSLVGMDFESIKKERNTILAVHHAKRVKKRDLAWYLKRLNLRYVKLFLNSKRNAKLYHENYASYLKDYQ